MRPSGGRLSAFLLAAALSAVSAAPAAAQNAYRAPVDPPTPMLLRRASDPPTQKKPISRKPAAKKPAARQKASAPPRRPFRNRDTAQDRRDYEMGTPGRKTGILIGRAPGSGDDVMSVIPPKRKKPAAPKIPLMLLKDAQQRAAAAAKGKH